MKIGFIGLGNVGGKLAGSLIRNGHDVTVRDLDESLVAEYVGRGAKSAASPKELGEMVDLIVTCLPSPAASSAVAEGEDGFLHVLLGQPGEAAANLSFDDLLGLAGLDQLDHGGLGAGGLAIPRRGRDHLGEIGARTAHGAQEGLEALQARGLPACSHECQRAGQGGGPSRDHECLQHARLRVAFDLGAARMLRDG